MVIRIEPNFQALYVTVSIHTTYPADFIEITDIVPQIPQFKR